MRFYGVALKLKLKELLHRPAYVMVLLILPLLVGILVAFGMAHKEESGLKAGIWYEEGSELGKKINDHLLNEEAICFVSYDDPKELENAVAIGAVECGFIINKNIEQGITLLRSPGSMADGVMQEVVTAAVYRYTSADMAYNVLKKKQYIEQIPHLREWINSRLEAYYSNGELMKIVYVQGEEQISSEEQKEGGILGLAKGLIAIFLLVGSMLVGVRLSEERKSKLYVRLNTITKKKYYPEIPLLVANGICQMLVVLITLVLLGSISDVLSLVDEVLLALVYIVALNSVVLVGSLWIKSSQVWFSAIPMLIIASVIFCPIVVDLSSMQTPLKYLSYLFLPYYYLTGMKQASILIGISLVGIAIYSLFAKRMNSTN